MSAPIAPFPYGITVEVERAPVDTVHGDVVYAVSHTIEGCADAPRYSTENNDNRTTVIVGRTLYGPYGADLQATDRVVYPGTGPRKKRTYRVVGDIGQWMNPFTGWKPGFEAALERVS